MSAWPDEVLMAINGTLGATRSPSAGFGHALSGAPLDSGAPQIKEPPPPIGPTEAIVLESLLITALLASQRYQGTGDGVTATATDVADTVRAYVMFRSLMIRNGQP